MIDMKSTKNRRIAFEIEKHEIESEQNLFGFDWLMNDYSFFTINQVSENESFVSSNLYIDIGLSQNKVVHKRSIYSILDFLADVGGIFDMMKAIGFQLVSFSTLVTGNLLNRFLVASIFKVNTSKSSGHRTNNEDRRVKKRKPALFKALKWFLCFGDRGAKRLYKQATEVVANEIDIIKFLGYQMIGNIHRRLVFTKTERGLIRHQFDPFVLDKRFPQRKHSDSDQFVLEETDSTYYSRLL